MPRAILACLAFAATARAQWTLQDSRTSAGLRGVHSIGGGIAWASGANGTILRTVNGGETWQTCAIPPDAAKLDFRGIQAFDAKTAIAMSAGKGDLSRVYKTTDACATWTLLFANPDADGFWDAIRFNGPRSGALIGDPVDGRFTVFTTANGGKGWTRFEPKELRALRGQPVFAASNSSLIFEKSGIIRFITGGASAILVEANLKNGKVSSRNVDLANGETAGGFSIASRSDGPNQIIVAVGGDYKLPARSEGSAATCSGDRDGNLSCRASERNPGGFRSAVAYDAAAKVWIAVGPNGTDISTDDGKTWRALKPTAGESVGADQKWNALSLPFAVGPEGRIGKLRAPVR